MATTARPGDHVEITAVQSYEVTWDDTLDRLIGLTGVLVSVNDSQLRENEETGKLDCAPFEVRIDRDAVIEAGEVVFAAGVRPVDTGAQGSAVAQTERRDRVRRAICEAEGFAWDDDGLEPDEYGDVADAVLAVLSEPTDQAAVRAAALRDAALHLYTALFPAVYNDLGQKAAEGVQRAVSELRRLADGTQSAPQPRTVAYRSPGTRHVYCVICARQETDCHPLTEVSDTQECHFCGGQVLAVASRTLGEVIARYIDPAQQP